MPRPTWEEVRDMVIRHAKLEVETKGEHVAIREMRKAAAWYTAGFPGSATLRRTMNTCETLEDMLELFEK